jgi:pyruvate/2-oxoglutarate dehydrogenase complex dihydrolipoamide acyltransferase (E2) component
VRHEIRLGALDEATSEAFVAEWLVQVGEAVEEGQSILEAITDKASFDVEADASGTLIEQCVGAEQRIAPGDLLAVLETQAT